MGISLDTVGSGARADDLARRLYYKNGAHQFKEENDIPSSEMSLYDMAYDKVTKKVYLVRKDGSHPPIPTGDIIPDDFR